MRNALAFAVLSLAVAPAAARADWAYAAFDVAGGAILCALSSDGAQGWVRCDVYEGKLSPFDRPEDCDSDFGRFFTVRETGPGFPSCESDMAYDPAEATALAPGAALEIAPFLCRAEGQGVTCTNPSGGGFTVTTDGQTVF